VIRYTVTDVDDGTTVAIGHSDHSDPQLITEDAIQLIGSRIAQGLLSHDFADSVVVSTDDGFVSRLTDDVASSGYRPNWRATYLPPLAPPSGSAHARRREQCTKCGCWVDLSPWYDASRPVVCGGCASSVRP
jgi:hypothetical protein